MAFFLVSLAFRSGALLSVFPAVGASCVVVGGSVVDEVEECGCVGADVFFFETQEGIRYRPYPA